MSDPIKHECAVALLRLLEAPSGDAPLAGSRDPGGTLLSLLLEKQHNRGQDGAGAAVLSLAPEPGQPAWWIRRSASATALADLLGAIGKRSESFCRKERKDRKEENSSANSASLAAENDERIFLGHLRYATYGRGDESFCHPFVHAEPRLDRTLFLAGNFNLTNTHELFEEFGKAGNHPGSTADGYLICELLACALADADDHTTPSPVSDAIASRRNSGRSPVRPATAASRPGGTGLRQDSASAETPLRIAAKRRTMREAFPPDGVAEQSRFCDPAPTILRALRAVLPKLDGAFTLCGMTGDGWAFAVRDAHGIRPGWYHASPRAVAVASERPAIQAALDCPTDAVRELPPGVALLVSPAGEVRFERVLEPAEPRPCVFERIYFSRANDADIHRERKALGAALAAPLLRAVDFDLDRTFFSYIPNSAQVAFHGLLEALWTEGLAEGRPVRFGQVAVKDAKFRTFIADAAARREIGKHVYDVTYGLVRPGVDTLVVLDDSIVRGTTMRDAILPMLDRLGPRRIVVASSAPPIRYPDCYGIDMSTLGELVAFRALENLLGHAAEAEFRAALAEFSSHAEFAESAEFSSFAAERHPSFAPQAHPSFGGGCHASANPLAPLYARFTDEQHAAEIARMLTPPGMRAEVSVVYQTVADLRAACPDAPGDWYFTGDYPTPGGYRVLRRSLENHLARRTGRSY
jgi:amidophosphoribosyltransferase